MFNVTPRRVCGVDVFPCHCFLSDLSTSRCRLKVATSGDVPFRHNANDVPRTALAPVLYALAPQPKEESGHTNRGIGALGAHTSPNNIPPTPSRTALPRIM